MKRIIPLLLLTACATPNSVVDESVYFCSVHKAKSTIVITVERPSCEPIVERTMEP